jgi:ATP phosphoribosyltransferase
VSLRLALPHGPLLAPVAGLLEAAGYAVGEVRDLEREGSRMLPDGVRIIVVAEVDVMVFVERGVAEVGFIGRETLLEWRPPVSELARLSLRPAELLFSWFDDDSPRHAERRGRVRVATPYPNVALEWLEIGGLQIEPVAVVDAPGGEAARSLADAMLSLVETGGRAGPPPAGTVVAECDVCVIAGHAARALHADEIADLLARLRAAAPSAPVTA